MDEILIEDKKYISSKQATKLTGYAKDYIGQLCREGRVPARLVGRNWYVLETAIADHRFGNTKKEALEAPRYEATQAETLPSIHRPLGRETSSIPVDTDQEQGSDLSEGLQDSWREWFDRINDPKPIVSTEEEPKEEPKREEEKGESIPMHALLPHHSLSAELLPSAVRDYGAYEAVENQARLVYQGRRKSKNVGISISYFVGVLIALLMATVASISTGYFDEYILSNSRVSIITGAILYSK